MKLILLSLSVTVLSITTITAQDYRSERRTNREVAREQKRLKKDSIQNLRITTYLSLDLISTILPNPLGRLNVGYITPLNEKWSLGGSAGLGINATAWARDTEEYFLWELRPELIYNLGKGSRFQHYVGLELFYIYHTETLSNRDFEPVNTLNGLVNNIDYDSATFERHKAGALINFGEYINLSNRLAFRTTVGVGIRSKDNSYSDLVNPRIDEFEDENHFGGLDPYRFEGTRLGVEFNLDFRLIYKIDY